MYLKSKVMSSKSAVFHLYAVSRIVRFIQTKSRIAVTRGWWQGGKGRHCLMGTDSSFGE